MADSGMRKVLRFRQAWRRVQKHGNSLHLTKIKGFFRPDRNISLHIHHFYMDHNNSFFSPKILHNHCFQFLLGITVVAKEVEDNGYAMVMVSWVRKKGGESFQGKDRRAHGMLLLTNQFHNLFEYLSVIGHKK